MNIIFQPSKAVYLYATLRKFDKCPALNLMVIALTNGNTAK
ncbi:hypothetical protein BN132_116 [Cronobacter turicensis 564]|nr:hypothetical protein BN132_116 [Cronobacter turicensis 564]